MHICIVMWLKSWGSVKVVTQCVVCVTLFLTKCSFSLAEKTTYDVNLAGAAVQWLVTGADSPRPQEVVAGSCSGLGAGPGVSSRAGPWYVINVTHRSSQLCSVTIDTFHQVRKKWCGKNLCASVWVSWDWVVIVYVSSQSLWSSRVHILVSCYWLSDVTARLAAAELTNSVSRCYTAAHLTVGWLGSRDWAVKKIGEFTSLFSFQKVVIHPEPSLPCPQWIPSSK